MPTIHLTEKSIARLEAPHPDGQTLYWDEELRGFGVLCSGTTNAKSYVVQHALRDGTRRRVTIARTNLISLDQAVVKAKTVLAEFYNGRDPKTLGRDNPTLRSTLDAYVSARTDLKPKSVEFYREAVNRHLDTWLDTPLRSITRGMVEDRLLKIAKKVAAGGRADYSGSAAANAAMRALRALYNFASERAPADNPMPGNPVKLKKVWLPVKRRTRSVAPNDMPKFYKAVLGLKNPVARDYLLLILFTGFRRFEAASLKWDHVDLRRRIISLPAANTKPGRALDLPMSNYVHRLLAKRRKAEDDDRYVFPADSKSGHIAEPKFALREVAEACGVKVSVHDLRRTFASAAQSLDLSDMVLKALLNHALPANDVTAGYVQMEAERLREPVQRVANKLKRLCKIP